MKTTNTKSYIMVITRCMLITAAFVFVFYGCKKPSDKVTISVNTSLLSKAPVLLHFANANSTSTNQPGDFAVTISGKDSALVQLDGGATSNFKASHGFLPLSLLIAANPTPSSPITFNVSAKIAGFAPLTQTVTITKDTATVIDISAIEYANPPSGASTLVASAPLTAGVSAGYTFKVPTNAGMTEAANIIIPAGTQMLDASGNLINASQLTASIVYYSPISTTSYGAFPGGFSPTNVVDGNGALINGGQGINFVSAGLISVKMMAGSTEVKHFSNPIVINMEINDNTTNFVTGSNIQAGDTIPWWSLNEDTGRWTNEGTATVGSEVNGQLSKSTYSITHAIGGKATVTLKPTHLSAFNLDWSWAVAGASYGTCNAPLKVTLHVGAGNSGVYDVALVTTNNQYLAALHGEYIYDGDVVTFPNTPQIAHAKVVISTFNLYLNPRLPIIAETAPFNPCTQGAIDLTVGAATASSYVNVSLNVDGHCSDKNISTLPSGWFILKDVTAIAAGQSGEVDAYVYKGVLKSAQGAKITNTNGNYSMQLIAGHQYLLEAWNSKVWYQSAPFTVSKTNFSLQSGDFSGAGVYDGASNTLKITSTFSVNCN